MPKKIEINKGKSKQTINPFEGFLSKYCSDEWMYLLKNYMEVWAYKKDQRIITEGDEMRGVYFVNDGMVKIVSLFDKDEERILRLSGRGSLVGHRGISFKNYPISAITLSDTEVTFIPLNIFIRLIKANPDFSLFLINFISDELRNTEKQIKNMIHGEVTKRVAYILCTLIDSFGYNPKEKNKLSYTLPRKDIADLAGTTYESVVRAISHLESKKIIKVDGKNLIITRETDLRKITGNKRNNK